LQAFISAEAALAHEQVMDAIVTQALAPGQKVSENLLSERFGISRSLARNLMERLIARRVLLVMSARVTVVAPLNALEVKQNFALRRMLQPAIWVQAAADLDYARMDALCQTVRALHPLGDEHSALQALKANKQLNLLPAEQTGYPLMLEWATQLEDTAMRIYWLYARAAARLPFSIEQEGRILAAMRSDDAVLIRTLVHDTLVQAEERVLTRFLASAPLLSINLDLPVTT
jgi:DNA-binding GntR family transcriptional regulator